MLANVDYPIGVHVITLTIGWRLYVTCLGSVHNSADTRTFSIPIETESWNAFYYWYYKYSYYSRIRPEIIISHCANVVWWLAPTYTCARFYVAHGWLIGVRVTTNSYLGYIYICLVLSTIIGSVTYSSPLELVLSIESLCPNVIWQLEQVQTYLWLTNS